MTALIVFNCYEQKYDSNLPLSGIAEGFSELPCLWGVSCSYFVNQKVSSDTWIFKNSMVILQLPLARLSSIMPSQENFSFTGIFFSYSQYHALQWSYYCLLFCRKLCFLYCQTTNQIYIYVATWQHHGGSGSLWCKFGELKLKRPFWTYEGLFSRVLITISKPRYTYNFHCNV